jgi:hypothetical protein
VFAKPASEKDKEEISKAVESDLAAILASLNKEPGLSLAGIAQALGWLNNQRKPDRSKVQRRVKQMEKKKLVERDGERLEITDKGKKWLGKRSKKRGRPEGRPRFKRGAILRVRLGRQEIIASYRPCIAIQTVSADTRYSVRIGF